MKRWLVLLAAACGSHDHGRRVDASSPYMAQLCAFAAHDPDAARAEIKVIGDGPSCTLRARDRDDHVPVRWARAHGCDVPATAAANEEVRCWTSGRDTLGRYLLGDRELAARGVVEREPALALPADRAFTLASSTATTGKDRHTYWTVALVERTPGDAPLVLDD